MSSKRNAVMQSSHQGWGRIEIAPTAILSVPYHNFRVSVYQRSQTANQDEEHQFYYTPLLLLRPESAKSVSNPFTKKHQVTFDVSMWDTALEQHLQGALINRLNKDVPLSSIRPLPVEQIRLNALEQSPLYTVDSNWQSNAMNSNSVTFRVNCIDKASCEELVENLKEYPELFADNLNVYYSLEAQQAGRRAITVMAQHARTAALATTLDQKFPGKETVYLKADDAKKLALEITTNVMATEIMEGDFVSNDQSLSVMNLIKTALDLTTVGTEGFSAEMWSSTFWHDDNTRPDKVTHTLNEIYAKSDSQAKVLMKNELADTSKSANKQAKSAEADTHQSGKAKHAASSDASQDTFSKGHFSADGGGWGVKVKVDAGSEMKNQSELSTADSSESEFDNSSHNARANSSANSNEFSKSSKNEDDRLNNILEEAKGVASWDGEKFVPKAMELTRLNISALRSSASLGMVQIQVTHTTATLSSRINVLPPGATPAPVPPIVPLPVKAPQPVQPGPTPHAAYRYLDEIIAQSPKIKSGTPDIYQAKLIQTAVDNKNMLRRYTVGPRPATVDNTKVILVLGATGAGKTTLINGFLNYMFGVKWEDGARLKVILEEGETTEQATSMTKFISAYEAYKQYDSPSPYSLTVIDTPGFGDTEGMSRDQEITAQLKEFFSHENKNFEGIDHVDAICIVVQSALARWTATQRYIFGCILSIFGKDIEKNIFLLCTFADGAVPPVLAAVEKDKLPFCKWFPFNNSALYAETGPGSGMLSKHFWEMGHISIMEFFKQLSHVESRSLALTREVLKEREALEAAINGLQPQINEGLANMEQIRTTRIEIEAHERKIQANENFTVYVNEPQIVKIDLAVGEYVTNCLRCNRTCHHPCTRPNNSEKANCAVMSGGKCTVCPQRCSWDQHVNNSFRIHWGNTRVPRTYDELKRAYEQGQGEKMTAETLLNRMQEHMDQVGKKVMELIFVCNESLNRLDQIALRPSNISTTEYVDMLIKSELAGKQPGYEQRITALQETKQRATMIERARTADIVRDGKRAPVKDPQTWISSFFSKNDTKKTSGTPQGSGLTNKLGGFFNGQ